MVRQSIVLFACVVLLAGCDRHPAAMPMELRAAAPSNYVPVPDIAIAGSPAPQQFSFNHAWSVLMARQSVAPRFTRARDLCLRDKSLSCKLVSANLSSDDDGDSVNAQLQVQLPHSKLDGFEKALLAPVRGETAPAAMRARSTQAQSVETEAADTAHKVAQLTAYRDRLADIAKRPNISVDDMIKVEAERSRVQDELDEATNHHRDLTDGIARESVSITLVQRIETVAPPGPIAMAFANAGDTLAENTAAVLLFLVGAIPWLPVVAGGIFVVARLWRRFRGARVKVVQPQA